MDIEAHFIKTKDFKTIQASGVVGGVFKVDGMINMTFFVERPPIPKIVTLEFDGETNEVSAQRVSADSKSGIIREVPVSVNMDIEVAKKVADWLMHHIQTFEDTITNIRKENAHGN